MTDDRLLLAITEMRKRVASETKHRNHWHMTWFRDGSPRSRRLYEMAARRVQDLSDIVRELLDARDLADDVLSRASFDTRDTYDPRLAR